MSLSLSFLFELISLTNFSLIPGGRSFEANNAAITSGDNCSAFLIKSSSTAAGISLTCFNNSFKASAGSLSALINNSLIVAGFKSVIFFYSEKSNKKIRIDFNEKRSYD